MILLVSSQLPELKQRILDMQNRLRRGKPKLLQIIANTLKRLATRAFTKLSRGEVLFSRIGVSWEPLTEKYKAWKRARGFSTRIGIRTGLMRRSSRTTIQGIRSVTLAYEIRGGGRNYAIDFDRRRTLLPVELPPEWEEEIIPQVQEWADDIVKDTLGKLA